MCKCSLILIAFFNAILFFEVSAQESVNSSGGEFLGSNGSINYSIGQISYTQIGGTGGTLSPGVQQPYEILVLTDLEPSLNITLNCTIFPNPAIDQFVLKINGFGNRNLSYTLYDIQGRIINQHKIIGSETSINISNLTASVYILKVTDGVYGLKTFKILKK